MGTLRVLTHQRPTAPCVNRPSSLPSERKHPGVLPQRESESAVSNEKPKRAAPPGNTFEMKCQPRNWLEAVILLSLRECNSYGYELMVRARVFGIEAMNTGTLYKTLRQMEKDGVVESSWDTSRGGPARRMYAMTDGGDQGFNRQMAESQLSELQNVRVLLEEARELYRNLAYHRRARLEAKVGDALDEVDRQIEELRSERR